MKYLFGISISLSTLAEKSEVKRSLKLNNMGHEVKPFWFLIQGVPGEIDKISGECSLC